MPTTCIVNHTSKAMVDGILKTPSTALTWTLRTINTLVHVGCAIRHRSLVKFLRCRRKPTCKTESIGITSMKQDIQLTHSSQRRHLIPAIGHDAIPTFEAMVFFSHGHCVIVRYAMVRIGHPPLTKGNPNPQATYRFIVFPPLQLYGGPTICCPIILSRTQGW